MTGQFPKFLVGGFLLFGPTVNCATQGRSARARTVANTLISVSGDMHHALLHTQKFVKLLQA